MPINNKNNNQSNNLDLFDYNFSNSDVLLPGVYTFNNANQTPSTMTPITQQPPTAINPKMTNNLPNKGYPLDIHSNQTKKENSNKEDEQEAKSFGRKVLNFFIILMSSIVIAYSVRYFIMCPYEIPSGSMLETIQIDDKIMAEKITYYTSSPKQGDIITFKDPQQFNRTLIKRVIATEGQTIDLRDGEVFIDDIKINEPYLRREGSTYELLEHPDTVKEITYPFAVPDGYVWVMGDNREESADSRFFGPVKKDSITGKAFFRYFPFTRFGFME